VNFLNDYAIILINNGGDFMNINITAGECLNKILKRKYDDRIFIPFCEAMINGSYSSKLFSDEFILERAQVHNVSTEQYKYKLQGFLDLLKNIKKYNEITLWFGDEVFCVENAKVVIDALKLYGYSKKIILNIVNEETGDIIKSKLI